MTLWYFVLPVPIYVTSEGLGLLVLIAGMFSSGKQSPIELQTMDAPEYFGPLCP